MSSNTSDFTGADLIADALAQLEVEHVFAIVSIHNMPILDAINRLGKSQIIDVRHEQAGTFMRLKIKYPCWHPYAEEWKVLVT